jgi:hypothetical protein
VARLQADPIRKAKYDEVARKRKAEWMAANPERVKAQARGTKTRLRSTPEGRARSNALRAAWDRAHPDRANAKVMRRNAYKRQAVPAWVDLEKVAEYYQTSDGLSMLTGEWFQVDHVVPLKSPLVCGLHNEFNLQVLPSRVNAAKGNRVWPDMP